MSIERFVRPNIQKLKPYSSARDEFEGNGEVFLDANESPYETDVNRYPDPYQRELKKEIAKIKGVNAQNIFLGNGSDEAIDLIFRIFCEPGKDNIIISDPTYGMYKVSADIHDIEVVKVPLSESFEFSAQENLDKVNDSTKVIFICSPNNPSGNDLSVDEIERVIKGFEGVVVIDEAYIDFSDQNSFSNKIDQFPNLIVLQTFSKAWGLAGLRLGLAYASEVIIGYFNKVKPPYNINQLTQKRALEALKNKAEVQANVTTILSEREKLRNELEQLPNVIEILPSDTNFLMVRFENAPEIFQYLLSLEVIIRDRSKALHCDKCLRITVGTPEENKKLIDNLKSYQQ